MLFNWIQNQKIIFVITVEGYLSLGFTLFPCIFMERDRCVMNIPVT